MSAWPRTVGADIICLGLCVQHTGTWFLGRMLATLLDRSNAGFPPAGNDPKLPCGFVIHHLWESDERATYPLFKREWLDGTTAPVLMSLRHPQRSMDTFWRRTGPSGVNGYGPDEHIRAFRRMIELLAQPRFHAVRVDVETEEERFDEVFDALLHIGHASTLSADWAHAWPVIHSLGGRKLPGPMPSVPAPRVPQDVVEALGYR